MTKEQRLLETARKLAETAETWADLSNDMFDPDYGLLAKAYRSQAERKKFIKTKEYKAIQNLVHEVQDRTGLVEGATAKKKSGKFQVRLPKTLRAVLEAEARKDGVSLNQFVLTALAMRIGRKKHPIKVIVDSSKFSILVTVPPAVHLELEAQAEAESVTFNELIIVDLAMRVAKKKKDGRAGAYSQSRRSHA